MCKFGQNLFIPSRDVDKPFSNNLSPPVTLKMGPWSPKSNQHFSPSQWYICVSLAKICSSNKEIVWTRGYADGIRTKNNMSPPPPRMVGGHNYVDTKFSCLKYDLQCTYIEWTKPTILQCMCAGVILKLSEREKFCDNFRISGRSFGPNF